MATAKFTSACIFAILLAGCNPVKFGTNNPAAANGPGTTGTEPGTPPPKSCTATNVEAITRLTKIYFLVDTSGSNIESTYNPGTCGASSCLTPATDPTKAFRGGAISDFLNRFSHKGNFHWGFAVFSQDSAHALINNGNDQSPIFATPANVLQFALNTFSTIQDYGNTPYHSALSMAATAISNDPDLHSAAHPNYFVILLTDGFPTDYYIQGQFNSQLMTNDIQSLLATAPGQVNLSSIYYGLANDPTAINLLKSMASMGGGQFAAATSTNQFKIDDVIPGSQENCP